MAQLKIDIVVDEHGSAAKLAETEAAVKRVEAASASSAAAVTGSSPAVVNAHTQNANSAVKAASAYEKLGAGVRNFASLSAAVFAGNVMADVLGSLVSMAKNSIAAADHLVNLSQKTGLSTDTLQRLEFVGAQASVTLDQFSTASFNLGVNLEKGGAIGKKVAADVKELGLNYDLIKRMNPDQQFLAIATALGQMENTTERNRIGAELMGKAFKTIAPAITSDMKAMLDQANVTSEGQLEALDRAGDAWDRWKMRASTNVRSFMGTLALFAEDAASRGGTVGLLNAILNPSQGLAAFAESEANRPQAPKNAFHGGDINLPSTGSDSFVASLAAAKAGYRDLTSEQRKNLDAAFALGVSNKDIIEQMGLTEGVLKIAKQAYTDHASAVKKAATEHQKYQALLFEVQQAAVPLDVQQKQQTQTLLHYGVGLSKIADVLGVTDAQVRNFNDDLKEQAKQLERIGAAIAAIPHGVQLRLPSRDMSSFAPQVDVGAVNSASASSGGLALINDATFNHIESRMATMGTFTKATLTDMAFAARDRYEDMKRSGLFTADALTKAFQDMNVALKAAGLQARMDWKQTFVGIAQDAVNAFAQGGMKGVGGWAKDFAKQTATEFAEELLSNVPVIGQFAKPIIEGFKKLWTHFFGTAGRDAVLGFADSMGGFDALHTQLNSLGADGEKLWIALTQGTGRNNPEQAQKNILAIQQALQNRPATMEEQANSAGFMTIAQQQKTSEDAAKLWQFMRDSGKFSAEAVQAAWERANGALIASGDSQALAAQKAKDSIAALDGQIKSLEQSLANEAPEEFIGVVEQQQRGQLEALKAQREEAAASLQAMSEASGNGVQAVIDRLNGQEIRIPVHFDVDPLPGFQRTSAQDQGFEVPEMASGGIVRARAGGTLVRLGEGGRDEMVTPLGGRGGGGMATVILELDGDVLVRALVPLVPGEVRRLGLA